MAWSELAHLLAKRASPLSGRSTTRKTPPNKKKRKEALAISWPEVPRWSFGDQTGAAFFSCFIASNEIPVSIFKFENLKSVRRTARYATHEPSTVSKILTEDRTEHRTNTVRDIRCALLGLAISSHVYTLSKAKSQAKDSPPLQPSAFRSGVGS